jgi:hypothetical protein
MIAWTLPILLQDPGELDRIDRGVRDYFSGLRAAAESRDPEVRERGMKILQQVQCRPLLSREEAHGVIVDSSSATLGLADAAALLQRSTGVRIEATRAAIETAGQISLAGPFRVSLSTMLDRACRASRLRWSVRDGGVVIDRAPVVPGDEPNQVKYDIRTLIQRTDNLLPSWPSPILANTEGGPGVTFTLEEPEEPLLNSDDIIELLTGEIDPEIWEESDRNAILMTPNEELLITAPKETHEKIRRYLPQIQRLVQVQWDGAVWLVAASSARARKISEEIATGRWGDLLGEALRDREISLVSSGRLVGHRGQRVGAVSHRHRSYVASYGEDGAPVLERFTEGTTLDVRVLPEREANLTVEFRMGLVKLLKVEKLRTALGEIENPQVARAQVRTTVSVPDGTPAVLSVLPAFPGPKPGQDTLVVVGRFSRFVPE